MFAEQDEKFWWKSKAQVGAVASTVSLIGAGFGLAIHPELVEVALPIVAPIVVSLISNVVTLWGNATRKQAIDTKTILPGVTTTKIKQVLHMVAGGD
jgi:hypothetical protein